MEINFFKKILMSVHNGMISKEHSYVAVIIRAFKRVFHLSYEVLNQMNSKNLKIG